MPAPTRINPIAGKVQGAEKIAAVMSVADMNAPKFATEIDIATTLFLEAFLRDFEPSGTQETGTAPRRVATRNQLPSLGSVNWEMPQLRVVWRPSEALSTDNNKAVATLTEGLELYILRRSDKDDLIAFAAAQFVDVFHIRIGAHIPGRSGDGGDQFAEYEMTFGVEFLRPPVFHKAIAS